MNKSIETQLKTNREAANEARQEVQEILTWARRLAVAQDDQKTLEMLRERLDQCQDVFDQRDLLVEFEAKVRAPEKTIYDLAQDLIANNPSWGDGRTVWGNVGERHIYVYQYQDHLQLVHQQPDRPTVLTNCAYLDPLSGWHWSLTRDEYADWARQCKNGKDRSYSAFLPPETGPVVRKRW